MVSQTKIIAEFSVNFIANWTSVHSEASRLWRVEVGIWSSATGSGEAVLGLEHVSNGLLCLASHWKHGVCESAEGHACCRLYCCVVRLHGFREKEGRSALRRPGEPAGRSGRTQQHPRNTPPDEALHTVVLSQDLQALPSYVLLHGSFRNTSLHRRANRRHRRQCAPGAPQGRRNGAQNPTPKGRKMPLNAPRRGAEPRCGRAVQGH